MNDVERQVLRLIGENTGAPDVFSDISPIRESINDAIQDLSAISGAYIRKYHLPLEGGRQIYRLAPVNDYILYVVSAYDRANSRNLDAATPLILKKQDPRWMESVGPVDAFFNLGFHLFGVYRVPSSDNAMLELTCCCIPKPYTTDEAVLKLAQVFQQSAGHLAVSEYYASRGDVGRAVEYLEMFSEAAKILPLENQYQERQYQLGSGKYGPAGNVQTN